MRRAAESPFRLAALFYLALAVLGLGLAMLVREGRPLDHPSPWLALPRTGAIGLSAGLGVALAALVVASTRLLVGRVPWARRLHDELRPFTRGLGAGALVLLALLSSVAEELLFRALLEPALGLVLSSLVFGLVHQLRGESRWVWASWAAVVGLLLGFLYHLTGSLVGPLLAHAGINALNLLYLRGAPALAASTSSPLLGRPGLGPRP